MAEKQKLGIMFGCFIPFHKAHGDLILKAMLENDKIILGVTGYDLDRGRDFIPFLRRVRLMTEIFQNDPRVIISEVDDRKIGLTGTFSESAWKTWCLELFKNARVGPQNPDIKYTWYTGEQAYIDKISTIYPTHNFTLISRAINPISGTKIRENPEAYIDQIHPVFREYLQKNYLKKI